MKKIVPGPPTLQPHPDLTFDDAHRYASHHLLFALRDAALSGTFDRAQAIERIKSAQVEIEMASLLLAAAMTKTHEYAVVPSGTELKGPWLNPPAP